MAQVGPFFDEKKLKVWLYEIAMRLSHAALVLSSDPEGQRSQASGDPNALPRARQYMVVEIQRHEAAGRIVMSATSTSRR